MDIAALNVRIKIQKNSPSGDAIGNRKNTWTDYFECSATKTGESNSESEESGVTVENRECYFTVRWCSETRALEENKYRIVYDGSVYDIIFIDHLNEKRNALKIKCEKERRNT